MKMVILETGLFPDSATVLAALNNQEPKYQIYRYDLTEKPLTDAEWDQLIDALRASDRIYSV